MKAQKYNPGRIPWLKAEVDYALIQIKLSCPTKTRKRNKTNWPKIHHEQFQLKTKSHKDVVATQAANVQNWKLLL